MANSPKLFLQVDACLARNVMKFGGLLTLEVEVELLVELEGAVVVLPVLAEEGQEPLLCDL